MVRNYLGAPGDGQMICGPPAEIEAISGMNTIVLSALGEENFALKHELIVRWRIDRWPAPEAKTAFILDTLDRAEAWAQTTRPALAGASVVGVAF